MDSKALAGKTMRSILPFVDVLIANEEDAADVLDIHAADTNVESGELSVDQYPAVAREIVRQFPNISKVCHHASESHSASHNNWGAMLYDVPSDQAFFAPLRNGRYEPYPDRKHRGPRGRWEHSFGAGLIFALNTPEHLPRRERRLASPSLLPACATRSPAMSTSLRALRWSP